MTNSPQAAENTTRKDLKVMFLGNYILKLRRISRKILLKNFIDFLIRKYYL